MSFSYSLTSMSVTPRPQRDFNSKYISWCCHTTTFRGRDLFNFLHSANLVVYATPSATFFSPRENFLPSTLELFIASKNIQLSH
ncbi:hypothetical protein PR048_021296, partial [Dryococelus australis]